MGSYPEAYDMLARLETPHLERIREGVEEDIRILTDSLLHPHGTCGVGTGRPSSGSIGRSDATDGKQGHHPRWRGNLERAHEPVARGSERSSSSARRIQPTTLQG
jgi:hypothetical protein